ncbi:MAG: hypothetical protein AM326_04190 [Candidatus Thorarchaeota archaeon SMTZ-45]|nr:MAG: hypothetical protein AM326_04190 [Candidatus Thorarchaeota archaeon SMTZ-45]KXH72582.1 MAG: hypothetical protein AM325_00700 [Candidatus Thorarchaeota archaeon SMTZ1-45]
MISTIDPMGAMTSAVMLVSILLALLMRYYPRNWSDLSLRSKTLLLSVLALATGITIFSFTYIVMYYLMYTTYPIHMILIMFLILFVISALIGSCCFGCLSVVQPRDDEVWTRWFKERDGWEEERKKSALADEE